jgi:hypothetical protein
VEEPIQHRNSVCYGEEEERENVLKILISRNYHVTNVDVKDSKV